LKIFALNGKFLGIRTLAPLFSYNPHYSQKIFKILLREANDRFCTPFQILLYLHIFAHPIEKKAMSVPVDAGPCQFLSVIAIPCHSFLAGPWLSITKLCIFLHTPLRKRLCECQSMLVHASPC